MDTSVTTHGHATHVAGTLAAGGTHASAKGMSHQAPLHAYEWDDDESEMAAAAAGMRVSNHSYGIGMGWAETVSGDWIWYGDPTVSIDEDYLFGFYNETARAWDEIAYKSSDTTRSNS